MSFVPMFTVGGPNQPSVKVTPWSSMPSYSAYTGESIGVGPVPFGTVSDAPQGHPNYGKPFHGGIVTTDRNGVKVDGFYFNLSDCLCEK